MRQVLLISLLISATVSSSVLLTSCKSDKNDGAQAADSQTEGTRTDAADTLSAEDYEKYNIENVGSTYPDAEDFITLSSADGSYSAEISLDEYRYYFLSCKEAYDGGDDSFWEENPDIKESIREYVLRELLRTYALLAECEKNAFVLTEEDVDYINMENAKFVSSMGDYDTFCLLLESYYLTPYLYNKLGEYSMLGPKLSQYYIDNKVLLTEDEDIRAYFDTDALIRCKHILISNDEGEDIEANRQLANDILARINNGEDFDALMLEYTEDPGVKSSPDGYYFFRGEMVESFEDASFALAVGEMSDIVESDFGFHIILRCEKEASYIDANFAALKSSYSDYRIYQIFDEVTADWVVTYGKDYETYGEWSYLSSLKSAPNAN
ncbi:MAG: peptidylprolyl isomerase [Clostridia bacterium]|nr:peptidylprolyl isomerase [Clostridia bacterium]